MNEYNCGAIFGSLVHRAQGYKRLRDQVPMSKIHASSMNIPEDRMYGLVTKNTIATNVVNPRQRVTLLLGSSVIVNNFVKRSGFAEVKILSYNDTNLSDDFYSCDFYWCSVDALSLMEKGLWNLIVAIPSPEERVHVIQDRNLLNELLSIEEGSIVRVPKLSQDGIVMKKRPVPELGPGFFFEVVLFDDSNGTLPHQKREHCNYLPVNELRHAEQICPSNKKSRENQVTKKKDEFDIFEQYFIPPDMKKMDDRSTHGSKSCKNCRFGAGDRIVWISNSGADERGTVCLRKASAGDKLRMHVGSECKEINCDRSSPTVSVPINEVMMEDEYNKRKNHLPQSEVISGLYSNDDVQVDDLLGIDQLDNCSTYRHSYGNFIKDYGDEVKLNNKFSSNVSNKHETQQMSGENPPNVDDLGIGSMVEVSIGGEPSYGVIKYLGPISYGSRVHNTLVAGIEMEEEDKAHGDGCLNGVRYFDCAPYRGRFTTLSQCKKDSRFQESPHPYAGETKIPEDFGKAVIPGIVEPISQLENIHLLCGKYKGIQGHNNSCYLDATLFSMFTFTSVFDDLLYRPANNNDINGYKEVQRVLREEIVNPLRKNLFVRSDRVMKLRTLLDNLTSVTGLTCEEKDPEEFLTSLVAQVLKAEPYLKLSSDQEAFYYQLFVEKDERLKLPTVQQLFEQSFISSDIKLKEVPSRLIIQMPRFGKTYKMYPRILPSQILDVTDVIENSPRQCSFCGELAYYECKECFKEEIEWFSFCQSCVKKAHLHDDRNQHKYTRITIPRELDDSNHFNSIPRHFMELFAVLCIETSHYVAFVKCGLGPDTPWCFFDSMADRKGGLSGYNIPEMVLCPDLPSWLSEGGAQAFCEMKDDRQLDPYAKRLLCDAYMCMYQSTDVMMYR